MQIICKKGVTCKKKPGDFNFPLESREGDFSWYRATISPTLPGLVSPAYCIRSRPKVPLWIIEYYSMTFLVYAYTLYKFIGNLDIFPLIFKTSDIFSINKLSLILEIIGQSLLVIGTSRTVGSAKKFVRITSGFGGGEFTKTLRKVCTWSKIKICFFTARILQNQRLLCSLLWRMLSRLETCIVYSCIWSVTLAKINRPTKNMTKIVTLVHFQVVLDKDAS